MRFARGPTALALAAALALSATAVRAQEAPGRAAAPPDSGRPASTAGMIAGGLFGGILGMVVGIPLGSGADDSSCRDCTRWGAAAGAAVGSTLGIAVGVHAANSGRGRFLPVLARSAAAMAGVFGASFVAYRAGAPDGVDMLLIPAGFVVGTVIAGRTERATMSKPLPAPPLKAAPSGN